MQKEISAQPRPTIPYEHPDAAMYLKLFKENLIRLRHKKPAYCRHDEAIRQVFDSNSDTYQVSLQEQCEQLVRYITEAFEHYAVWDYTHAYYPGRPSQQTARTDAMEGVSRVLPTLAAWLHANGETTTVISGLNNKAIDVAELLRTAFLAGTNPEHKGYWGQLHDYDQRICESADLALALWLSRTWVWDSFSSIQQQQIAAWFKQVNTCQTVDNNWHLFPLTVQLVLKALTGEDTIAHDKYARIKEFYVGDGWFRDGARGNYDYYNAWGFFYSLYWLDQIDPAFDSEFIRHSLSTFVEKFRYFFTAEGVPFFGRSVCYRLAASAPLLAAIDTPDPCLSVGEAKRAFRTSLEYFIRQGAFQHGAPTQGVFADDPRLVDNYSGPASSFWSLRALNIALFSGARSGLWQTDEVPLEIEKGDFSFEVPAIEASIIGTFKTKEVVVIFHNDYISEQSPFTRRLARQLWSKRILEKLLGRAERPKNNLLRKGVTCYTSKMFHFF